MVKLLLYIEGLVFFLVALYLYQYFQGNWWLFLSLILVPDIAMVGYVRDKKAGAILYNLMHNYVLAVIVISAGYFLNQNLVLHIGLVLLAHVAMDRFFGYGLKYPSHFKDTHMQRV